MKKTIVILVMLSLLCIASKAQLIAPTGSLHTARQYHCSELLNNGFVLAFGGDDGSNVSETATSSAELFNPVTHVWTVTGSMNRARTMAASVLLDDGNVLVAGGDDDHGHITASCEIYNVITGTWSYTDSLTHPRTRARLIKLNNGKIMAVAGTSEFSCELFDQVSHSWVVTSNISYSRSGSFWVIKLSDGNIFLTGGHNEIAEIYNVTAADWNNVAAHNLSDYDRQAIMMKNGKVLIAGGDNYKNSSEFSPGSQTYTNTGDLITKERECQLMNLSNGKVLLFGIGNYFPDNRECLQIYNPNTGTWAVAGNTGPSVQGANRYTAHTLYDGKILYVGGRGPSISLGAQTACYLVDAGMLTGIANSGISGLGVFPNPNQGSFDISLEMPPSANYNIRVLNMYGQQVYASEMTNDFYHVDLNNASKGIYQLVISDNGNTTVKRIIVQ